MPGNDMAHPSLLGNDRLPVSSLVYLFSTTSTQRGINRLLANCPGNLARFKMLPATLWVRISTQCLSIATLWVKITEENIELKAVVFLHTVTLANAQQAVISHLEQYNAHQPHDYAQPFELPIFEARVRTRLERGEQTTVAAAGQQASTNARLGWKSLCTSPFGFTLLV